MTFGKIISLEFGTSFEHNVTGLDNNDKAYECKHMFVCFVGVCSAHCAPHTLWFHGLVSTSRGCSQISLCMKLLNIPKNTNMKSPEKRKSIYV